MSIQFGTKGRHDVEVNCNDTLYKFKYYYESNEFWLEEENILKK